ncbi:DUF2244 domain-containing protein [Wenzhouxiangella sp. AB-CW3]|uniref:DUF2244 domain-containing protein n=1 Tax=Wenzhouxiangella sp. AB-CW3 TaxID=2771012 RepID=UPI00168AAE6F|nr:DUF2244 domain-containing protein [Wenzhouxiangella sp. AB-CW3]QOC24019.1 DUF2244 domain-containing protein [Wenzhouxiangella sp. AB-CW3]
MIEVQHSKAGDDLTVIEARSNLSMTLDRLAAVFLGLSAVVLLLALATTIMGYWPIMLVAVAHLVLVGWCLRLAWRGNWARERFLVGRREVVVEHYDHRQQKRTVWPASWLRVKIKEGALGERHVVLSCQGRRQVIGSFLPVPERLDLARALKECLRPRSAWSDE